MEMHWNVLVSISTKWTLVIYSRRKISLLGLWYIGVSGYMASALKTSSVEGQSNLPLVFAVLSKLMISGSDTGSICSLTEILSSAQPSSRVKQDDSTCLWGWLLLCWYSSEWVVVLVSAQLHSSALHFSSQLWVYARHTCTAAWSSSVEVSADCRTCLRSWESTQAIKICGDCSKAITGVWATWLKAGRLLFIELPGQQWVSRKSKQSRKQIQKHPKKAAGCHGFKAMVETRLCYFPWSIQEAVGAQIPSLCIKLFGNSFLLKSLASPPLLLLFFKIFFLLGLQHWCLLLPLSLCNWKSGVTQQTGDHK